MASVSDEDEMTDQTAIWLIPQHTSHHDIHACRHIDIPGCMDYLHGLDISVFISDFTLRQYGEIWD